MLSKLYAVTDDKLIGSSLTKSVELAILGGVGLIQLREKNISDELYINKAEEILPICRKYGAKLIINDKIDVCLKSGADGVHLGQSDASPIDARKILGENAIIGVTAKTHDQVEKAVQNGANYIGSGAVFGTATKIDAKKMEISFLKELAAFSKIPVYAIGGINSENIRLLKGCGIYGIAVVSGIFNGDIRKNVEALSKAVNEL